VREEVVVWSSSRFVAVFISSEEIENLILGYEIYLPALTLRRTDIIKHKAIMAFIVLKAVENISGNN
jgi:hypothetical protein